MILAASPSEALKTNLQLLKSNPSWDFSLEFAFRIHPTVLVPIWTPLHSRRSSCSAKDIVSFTVPKARESTLAFPFKSRLLLLETLTLPFLVGSTDLECAYACPQYGTQAPYDPSRDGYHGLIPFNPASSSPRLLHRLPSVACEEWPNSLHFSGEKVSIHIQLGYSMGFQKKGCYIEVMRER
ncbi:hypothetical protein OIU85_000639 [Salix viminalis]|uniref:Uncharacterized protein n=1 Tax=Salix viminalis TaxID=40686 RepID=A0A9Q0ZWZ0_SALVM|nr:hypothetical protein OIU85_000639 [Salix viminalis]